MSVRQSYSPISPQWALWAFLGAVVGAAFVAFVATGGVKADTISYTDLAAVMLAAVTLILTALGLAVAIAAIYGYRAFMEMTAEKAAQVAREEAIPAAIEEVKTFVATNAEPFLVAQAEAVALRVLTPERLQSFIREQINAVLLGSDADDELDKDEEQEGPLVDRQDVPEIPDDQ